MPPVKLVRYSDDAIKDLRRYRHIADRLRRSVAEYAAGDGAHANKVTQLVGRLEKRLRVGAWRILFLEDDATIVVLRVAPRGRAYE